MFFLVLPNGQHDKFVISSSNFSLLAIIILDNILWMELQHIKSIQKN